MSIMLNRSWWVLALRGIAAIIFGLLTFIWPQISLFVLVALFGAYVLVDGIFSIIVALRNQEAPQWWVLLLEGIVGVFVGVLTFIWPGITALVLLFLIAFWALITGIFEIVAAIRLRKDIANEWLLGLSGVISVLFGLLLIILPGTGALAVIWLIGAYAIFFGALMLALSFQVRRWRSGPGDRVPSAG
jgi:uncharacterized membrane protein HdeD (DUF308 family)